jgi:hypothetical protein
MNRAENANAIECCFVKKEVLTTRCGGQLLAQAKSAARDRIPATESQAWATAGTYSQQSKQKKKQKTKAG